MIRHIAAALLLALSGCTGTAALGGGTSLATQIGSSPDMVCTAILQQSAAGLAQLKAQLNGVAPIPAVK